MKIPKDQTVCMTYIKTSVDTTYIVTKNLLGEFFLYEKDKDKDDYKKLKKADSPLKFKEVYS